MRQIWYNCQDWNDGNPVQNFHKIAKTSLAKLKLWSKEEFGGRQREDEKLMNQLTEVKQNYKHYKNGNESTEYKKGSTIC